MWWIAVIVIVLLVGGIVYFSLTVSGRKKTREQFLRELAEFMEGSLESFHGPDQPNAFRVVFDFEGEKFIYEDLEEVSFHEKLFKGYLKSQIGTPLDLYFTEKEKSEKIIQPGTHFQSPKSVGQSFKEKIKVDMPKILRHFNVYTNHAEDTNSLLADDKVARVFAEFKNADSRGRSFLSLRILHGEIILDFYSAGNYTPSRSDLMNNVASMENYVKKFLLIIKRIKEIEQKKKDNR